MSAVKHIGTRTRVDFTVIFVFQETDEKIHYLQSALGAAHSQKQRIWMQLNQFRAEVRTNLFVDVVVCYLQLGRANVAFC